MKKVIMCFVLIFTIVFLFIVEKRIGLFDKNPYSDYINKYSSRFDIDPSLVKAIMKKESNLNPNAISSKGAVGLMQIMPKTGLDMAIQLNIMNYSNTNLKDIETNIMFGTYYIKKLLDYYNNDLVLSLAAYNAGIGNIDNWQNKIDFGTKMTIDDIPFKETRYYVKSVVLIYKIYIWVSVLKEKLNIFYPMEHKN
jgi:soluble lytic murein transglycosylase